MPNYVSTSKDVGNAKSGGGGNSANIANQAISAYGNSRTVAPSAGGGVVKTPQQAKATASPGSKAKPQRNINEPPQNAVYGYTPGGFDDPTIDWQAIYDIFVAPTLSGGGGGGGSSMSRGSSPAQVFASPAPAMEAPASIMASPAQIPQSISAMSGSVANAPTGEQFQTFGGSPSTYGEFQRLRNQRGPLSGASMTPEMLRRAAASRLG